MVDDMLHHWLVTGSSLVNDTPDHRLGLNRCIRYTSGMVVDNTVGHPLGPFKYKAVRSL
jgi:hypothetical protein